MFCAAVCFDLYVILYIEVSRQLILLFHDKSLNDEWNISPKLTLNSHTHKFYL